MEYEKLRELLAENADRKEAEKMSAYMQGKCAFFGVPAIKRRELSAEFFANDNKSDSIDWKFIFDCFKEDEREMHYSALDYLEKHTKQLTSKDIPSLKRLAETKSWWDTIDTLDDFVGSIALKDRSVNQTLLEWSVDKNFWLRRIAIDHQLRFKDKTNTELLAEIIKNNLGQEEFFINKAIGWALREYSKTNPDWVREFIAENESKMSKLSIREACKKIQNI